MAFPPWQWISRWFESADPHIGLDELLARARPEAPAAERLAWLRDLAAWLKAGLGPNDDERAVKPQTVRLRHLLGLLERHPDRKDAFARTLRATIDPKDAFDLLLEAGMPRESGFLGELTHRLFAKVLPEPPAEDLVALFAQVFPDRGDAELVQGIAEENWKGVLALFAHGEGAADFHRALARAAGGSVPSLAVQACGSSLLSAVRRRMQVGEEPLAAWTLPTVAKAFAEACESGDAGVRESAAEALRVAIGRTLAEVDRAYARLDEQGVSIAVVYQLERIRAQAQRMGELSDLLAAPDAAPRVLPYFLAGLIRDVHDQRSAAALFRQNFELAARKVVERNAETGEHYITRTRSEYADMVRRASGGGALMAFTTYVKFAVASLHWPLFVEGLLASLNYAATFVAIQFMHLTVATKQPAMTAPAMAARMKGLQDPERLEGFVDEVAHLVRSQSAAIFGNVFVVFPATLALGYLLVHGLSLAPVSADKAAKTIDSLSVFGPSALFAAFTGVLLWASSVLAGWADNWFAYRRLGAAIGHHRRLAYVFGPSRMQRVGAFLSREIAGITANVSLGFMLGLIPEIFLFFGLPVEVRHVTLSTGQIAASVVALGWGVATTTPFLLALAGIAVIGFLNVGVSYALALNVAIGARAGSGVGRGSLYRAVLRRLATRPLSFLFPPR